MLKELPRHCSLGVKKGSNEHQQCWRGYKLQLDVADGQIPIACLLTAASLHDSQAAIPLATMTAQRVTSLYDLMDCVYDANHIRAVDIFGMLLRSRVWIMVFGEQGLGQRKLLILGQM